MSEEATKALEIYKMSDLTDEQKYALASKISDKVYKCLVRLMM